MSDDTEPRNEARPGRRATALTSLRPASKKARRRERKAARRHGLTIEQYRTRGYR